MTDEERIARAKKILQIIRQVRNEHNACTMREVARRQRTQPSLMLKQLENLRAAGYVEWTEMTGSLKLTAKGGKFANT